MSTRMRIAVVVAGVVLLAAGCQRAAQQQPPAAEPVEAQVVNVVAKEFTFEPKEIRVKAGMVKFLVENEGTGEHASETFTAGVTHEVEVELKPGTYPVSCNVPGHKEAGMVALIIVE